MAAKFFRYPFAVSGDRLAIPDPTQGDGYVSYQQGFGPDYEKNLITDPAAKPIPRDQFNELMFEVTLAIQQYQSLGFPDFITSSDNGGTPYPYDKYAVVRFNDGSGVQIYQSIITNNDQLPTNTSAWNKIGLFNNNKHYSILTLNSGQTLPAGISTIEFDTIYQDPFGYVSGNGFSLPTGIWEFNVRLIFISISLSNYAKLNLYKNGALVVALNTYTSFTMSGTTKFYSNEGDIFTCSIDLESSATISPSIHNANIFEVQYVGE